LERLAKPFALTLICYGWCSNGVAPHADRLAPLALLTIISQSAASQPGENLFAGEDVSRSPAADDFPAIRARMEELRRVTRPRAADDFRAIRARMEELRRQRADVQSRNDARRATGPRPYAVATSRR
jgi:hypothetical protein